MVLTKKLKIIENREIFGHHSKVILTKIQNIFFLYHHYSVTLTKKTTYFKIHENFGHYSKVIFVT